MNRLTKTQTIRISPEIHKLAKKSAIDAGVGLQVWIENIITKELENNKEGKNGKD